MNIKRENAIASKVALRVKEMLLSHLEEIENDAVEGADPDSDKPVKAKVSFKVAWSAGEPEPKIETSIGWTVSKKEECVDVADWKQGAFDFGSGVDKVTMKVGDSDEVTVFEREGGEA